jgi:hypothetical protein
MTLPAPIVAALIGPSGAYRAVSDGWAEAYGSAIGEAAEWAGLDHVATFNLEGDWLSSFRCAQAGEVAFHAEPVRLPSGASLVMIWALVPLTDGAVICAALDAEAVAAALASLVAPNAD